MMEHKDVPLVGVPRVYFDKEVAEGRQNAVLGMNGTVNAMEAAALAAGAEIMLNTKCETLVVEDGVEMCIRDRSMPDRIIAVADIVSALVGTRSYKKAYPKEKVLELLAWHVETGKIDCIVVETMTRDYDAIMLSVAAACQPVAAAYERVQSAYALMLGKLKRWQAENEGRSA